MVGIIPIICAADNEEQFENIPSPSDPLTATYANDLHSANTYVPHTPLNDALIDRTPDPKNASLSIFTEPSGNVNDVKLVHSLNALTPMLFMLGTILKLSRE